MDFLRGLLGRVPPSRTGEGCIPIWSCGRRSGAGCSSFIAVIDEILEADRSAPPKQRHTARRIFHRLRDEHGYGGSEVQVRRYVAQTKRHAREVFVPLSHPPGEAQFDFGEATVMIAGVRCKAAFAVMTLPFSDAWHLSAYPRECTETFQAAHVAAFEFFGGVPTRTSYDNTTIAVKKVVGTGRELTREFLRLESHFATRKVMSRASSATADGTRWSRSRSSPRSPR